MSVGERAYEVAAAAIAFAAARWPAGDGKLRRAVRLRRDVVERMRRWGSERRAPGRALVWMHAASVGEGLQAKAVLERLRARRPELQLFYTYFSPSAEPWVERLSVDGADVLPFDRARDLDAALAALRPDAIVFSKLDVWPVLTRVAHEGGVPLALVSATLARGSSRLRLPARWFLREAYRRLDRVGAIAEEDADRLVRLGARAERVAVTGDARFDQVWARAQAVDRSRPPLAPLLDPGRVTLVAGSTWPEDEKRLLPAVEDARRAHPALRLILVPHEPEPARVEAWVSRLAAAGWATERFSARTGRTWDALVVDRVGVLGDLYAAGGVAFVGGAFGTRGIHSVLEPAAAGLPVLFGPRHENAREAAELAAAGGAFPAATRQALAATLRSLLGDEGARRRAGAAARRYVESRLGAADRNADLVLELVGRGRG